MDRLRYFLHLIHTSLTFSTVPGALKYSTLDSAGMGVEMEGGKPGWNDAMNGLPGLLGESVTVQFILLLIV